MLEIHIESAQNSHKKADFDNLRKEAEGLSYISLNFVQTQVLDFSSTNYKKCIAILNSLESKFKKIQKLVASNGQYNYEGKRI